MSTQADAAREAHLPIARSGLPRQGALFLSFLISGGLLLFPRVPILLAILLLCLISPGSRLVLRRETAPAILLALAVTLLTILRPGPENFESLTVRLGNFLAGFALLNLYMAQDRGTLADDLYRILGWMAAQALLTVALAHTLGFLFRPIEIADVGYQTFALLLNYHVTIEDVGGLIRPDGFFFEPGVFQIYLNLYLYLALFVYRDARRSAFALAAVLSTQSTTGLAVCLLLLGGFVLGELRKSALRRKIVLGLAATIVAVPIAMLAYSNATQKLFGEYQGSFWARTYDLITGFNVLAAHPLAGIGFDRERYQEEASRLGYAELPLAEGDVMGRDTTNGVLFLLYGLGIPLSLPFLAGMFRQRFLPHRLMVGLLLFLSFLSESIVLTPFFLLLIFSGLAPHRPLRAAVAPVPQSEAG